MVGFNEAEEYDPAEQKTGGWVREPLDAVDLNPEIVDRILVDYAAERYQWLNYQGLASKVNGSEIKRVFIQNSFEEEGHLKDIGSLLPFRMMSSPPGRVDSGFVNADRYIRQETVGLENAVISGFAEFGQVEPERGVKNTFEYILLDHVAHAKSFNGMFSRELDVSDSDPKSLIDNCRYDRWEGRPLHDQFIRTDDLVKEHYDYEEIDPVTKIRIYTMIAVEMTLLNQFQSYIKKATDQDLRNFYALVCGIEVEHVAMLNSLIDPFEPSLELAITGELMEIYNHKRSMGQVGNRDADRSVYHAFKEDLEHLRVLVDIADELGIIGIIERIPADISAPVPELSVDEYISELMKTKLNVVPSKGFFKDRESA